MVVDTINVCKNGPHILAYLNYTLPPRILAIFNAWVELRENPQEHTDEVRPNNFLSDQYPCMAIIPAIHIVLKQTARVVPYVLVNLSIESNFLSKNKILGFWNK